MQGCSGVRRARRDAPYRFTEVFNGRARPSRRAEVCQAASPAIGQGTWPSARCLQPLAGVFSACGSTNFAFLPKPLRALRAVCWRRRCGRSRPGRSQSVLSRLRLRPKRYREARLLPVEYETLSDDGNSRHVPRHTGFWRGAGLAGRHGSSRLSCPLQARLRGPHCIMQFRFEQLLGRKLGHVFSHPNASGLQLKHLNPLIGFPRAQD